MKGIALFFNTRGKTAVKIRTGVSVMSDVTDLRNYLAYANSRLNRSNDMHKNIKDDTRFRRVLEDDCVFWSKEIENTERQIMVIENAQKISG